MEQYQVSFGEAIKRAFSNYCKFTGRASRSEYWWFTLFVFLVAIGITFFTALMTVLTVSGSGGAAIVGIFAIILWILFAIAIILPSWGLTFRRLHDTGRSGWWILLTVVPYLLSIVTIATPFSIVFSVLNLIGGIILLVFLCQPSQPEDNQYGPVPNTYYDNAGMQY